MYKRLKPELEKIVDNLNKGDGIIILHPKDYPVERSIGFVKSINGSHLILYKNRKPRSILEKLLNHVFSQTQLYEFMEDIKVVYP